MNNINNNINSNQLVISVNKVTHHIFTDDDVDGLECNLAASSKAFFLISKLYSINVQSTSIHHH
jgi:hypothetical protein